MAASVNRTSTAVSGRSRRRWVWFFVFVPACFAATCWWLTEPLKERTRPEAPTVSALPVPVATAGVKSAKASLAWPEGKLEGADAKRLLLRALLQAGERLNKVESYTATFHKQERINGKLGPEQTLAMKVRQRPFAVYLKFLAPTKGKEVVYAEGHHDNKVIAHGAGVARFLVPRLAVPPEHPLALADSRHAVTEVGVSNLTSRLIRFREKDLDDDEAVTILDRATDCKGRSRLRSVHLHPKFHEERPFAKVEVLYEPGTFLPLEIRNYDWPRPGHEGDLLLAEHYSYEDLRLDATLTAMDFDPANPDYAFHRY